ncbi:MAG: hypothetical protein ACK4YP_19105 [Myxococcota bacterium]
MRLGWMRVLSAGVGRDLARHGAGLALLFAVWHVPVALAHAWLVAGVTEPVAAEAVATLAIATLYVPLLGGIAYVTAGGADGPRLVTAAVAGMRRWLALFPAWLVYTNRLAVGLVLGVVPGLVWLVQGRFLAQAAALRPDVPPFEHSRAVTAGAWWPVFGLTGLSVGTQLLPLSWSELGFTAVAAGDPSGFAHVAGAGLAAALVAGFWCVVDTAVFLHLEQRNGLSPGGADATDSTPAP